MPKTYTIMESIEALDVDPKTFRKWLKRASFDRTGQVSKFDERVKFLTEDQVKQLATDHGRPWPPQPRPVSQQSNPVTLGTFKLATDRIDTLEHETRHLNTQAGIYRNQLDTQEEALERHADHIAQQQKQLAEAKQQISELQQQLTDTQAFYGTLVERLTEARTIITTQAEQAAQIVALFEQITALQQQKPARRQAPRDTPDLPAGTIPARAFAEAHSITRDRIEGMIRRNEIATTPTPLGSRTQHQLTPEQQESAIAFWDAEHIKYQRCQDCPHTPA